VTGRAKFVILPAFLNFYIENLPFLLEFSMLSNHCFSYPLVLLAGFPVPVVSSEELSKSAFPSNPHQVVIDSKSNPKLFELLNSQLRFLRIQKSALSVSKISKNRSKRLRKKSNK
jgi:hypothetical protein